MVADEVILVEAPEADKAIAISCSDLEDLEHEVEMQGYMGWKGIEPVYTEDDGGDGVMYHQFLVEA